MRNPGRMQHVSRVRTRPVHAAAINKACGGVREINKMLVTMLTLCNFGACLLQRSPPERWRNTFWIGKARLHTRTGLWKHHLGKSLAEAAETVATQTHETRGPGLCFGNLRQRHKNVPGMRRMAHENISRMQRTPSRNTKPRRIGV